jgi:hypothetical protein
MLLATLALCPHLWSADRPFPTVPILETLPDLPPWSAIVLTGLFVSSLIAVVIHPRPARMISAALATGGVLVCFDINRLQPWLYYDLLLLSGLALVDWKNPDAPRTRAGTALCGFVVAATYFWSGLNKANGTFAADVFPWLLQPLGAVWVERLRMFWFAAPMAECAIGVLLVIPRGRRWALGLAVAMHAGILLAIGPLGRNTNSVIWPWNIETPLLAFALFHRNGKPLVSPAWSVPAGKFVVILVGVLPALNFAGWWDAPLSASLYSGKSTDGWIYLTAAGADRLILAEFVRREAMTEVAPGRLRLDIHLWAQAALNTPSYGAPRVYRQIMRKLEASGIPRKEMKLLIRHQPVIGNTQPAYSILTDW